tara:strand:+ start:4590 stop:4814 length:225 start_codon:yes stop_codon:yes gene_type:complete
MSIQLGNTFWKEVIAGRDVKIAILNQRIHELEAQLSVAFEIMTDRQVEENKHLFQQQPNKGDSDSTNNNGDETQ